MGRALGVGVGRGVTLGVTVGVALGVGLAVGVGVAVGPGSPPFAVQKNRAAIANCDPSQRVAGEGNVVEIGGGPTVWSVQVIPPSVL